MFFSIETWETCLYNHNPHVQKILLRNVELSGIEEELFIEQSFASHMSSEIKVWSRKFYISYELGFINRESFDSDM